MPRKFKKATPPLNQLSIRIASSNQDEIFFGASQYTQLSKDIESAALLRRGRMLQVQIHPTFFVTPTVHIWSFHYTMNIHFLYGIKTQCSNHSFYSIIFSVPAYIYISAHDDMDFHLLFKISLGLLDASGLSAHTGGGAPCRGHFGHWPL